MNFYFGANLVPGQSQSEFQTQEGQITWGKWFVTQTVGGLVDKDTVDAGNTGATTILRPGLALGAITGTGQLTHWDPYGTDGSNRLVGFYIGLSQNMGLTGGTTTERWLGDILVAGNVQASAVVVPGQTTPGLSGTSYEWLLRQQCAGRFLFNDDFGSYMALKTGDLTADVTITEAQNMTLFTLRDAVAASVTATLPAPKPGLVYGFVNLSTTGANVILLEGPATGEYWVAGAAANSVSLAGDVSIPRWVRAVRQTTAPVYNWVVEA